MSIVALTMPRSSSLLSTPETNERSTLSTSMGKRLRRLSDEYPVPKSSRARASPASWSMPRDFGGESASSSMNTVSVISSVSVPARSPLRSAMATT